MTIRKLDESMVVRIAAGEVIERPAAVVKELVENAYDAGARNVTVRIERGGLGLIEVADDGCGIAPSELAIAVERHATSKLSSVDDLESITTLGFRGEALATIAAVGRLTLVSRVPGDHEQAMQLSVGERYPSEISDLLIEPAARSQGTTVVVRDLFVRTPARLKFMKSESSEYSKVSDMLERLALARPDVAVELIRDKRRIFRTPGNGRLRDAVAELFGAELARDMIEVTSDGGAAEIDGLISPPHLTRKNRTGLYYHLGGRPIEDRSVAHAITSAYEGLLPGGVFPIVFLGLSIDPREVDVNVHPAKAEVRFRDSQKIHRLVSQALRARLQGNVSLPVMVATAPDLFGAPAASSPSASPGHVSSYSSSLFERGMFSPMGPDTPAAAAFKQSDKPHQQQAPLPVFDQQRALELRYSGEIAGRYLLAEDANGLIVIDQHAAHERVIFDKLMRQAQNGEIVESPLLVPLVLEMSASDQALVEEQIPLFAEIGIELEVWPGAVSVRAVPAVLARIGDAGRMIRDVLDTIKEGGEAALFKVPYARLAMEACKAAVKGTQRLDPAEARALLDDLVATTDPYNCPHGRPTMVRMTIRELDKRFGRIS